MGNINEEKVIQYGNGIWMKESQLKFIEDMQKAMVKRVLHMTSEDIDKSLKRSERNKDNRKWAWIIIGKTKRLAWVDNKTMKAYKASGYNKTWMEIKRFTFDRWATGFDL